MKIYFACSITGGRQDESTYQAIVESLIANNHLVPTAGLASSEVTTLEGIVNRVEVYERDTAWIRDCDVLIAEVSTPSHGVGYEIGYALNLGKPTICIYQEGTTVSKMITGNQDPLLQTFAYKDIEGALVFLHARLNELATW
jgi:nucleoside 2-deoxyribosyltransferase